MPQLPHSSPFSISKKSTNRPEGKEKECNTLTMPGDTFALTGGGASSDYGLFSDCSLTSTATITTTTTAAKTIVTPIVAGTQGQQQQRQPSSASFLQHNYPSRNCDDANDFDGMNVANGKALGSLTTAAGTRTKQMKEKPAVKGGRDRAMTANITLTTMKMTRGTCKSAMEEVEPTALPPRCTVLLPRVCNYADNSVRGARVTRTVRLDAVNASLVFHFSETLASSQVLLRLGASRASSSSPRRRHSLPFFLPWKANVGGMELGRGEAEEMRFSTSRLSDTHPQQQQRHGERNSDRRHHCRAPPLTITVSGVYDHVSLDHVLSSPNVIAQLEDHLASCAPPRSLAPGLAHHQQQQQRCNTDSYGKHKRSRESVDDEDEAAAAATCSSRYANCSCNRAEQHLNDEGEEEEAAGATVKTPCTLDEEPMCLSDTLRKGSPQQTGVFFTRLVSQNQQATRRMAWGNDNVKGTVSAVTAETAAAATTEVDTYELKLSLQFLLHECKLPPTAEMYVRDYLLSYGEVRLHMLAHEQEEGHPCRLCSTHESSFAVSSGRGTSSSACCSCCCCCYGLPKLPEWILAFSHTRALRLPLASHLGTMWREAYPQHDHHHPSSSLSPPHPCSFFASSIQSCIKVNKAEANAAAVEVDRDDDNVHFSNDDYCCVPWLESVPSQQASLAVLEALAVAAVSLVGDIADALHAAATSTASTARVFSQFCETLFGREERLKLARLVQTKMPFEIPKRHLFLDLELDELHLQCVIEQDGCDATTMTAAVRRTAGGRIYNHGSSKNASNNNVDEFSSSPTEMDSGGVSSRRRGRDGSLLYLPPAPVPPPSLSASLRCDTTTTNSANPQQYKEQLKTPSLPSVLSEVHYMAFTLMTRLFPSLGEELQNFLSRISQQLLGHLFSDVALVNNCGKKKESDTEVQDKREEGKEGSVTDTWEALHYITQGLTQWKSWWHQLQKQAPSPSLSTNSALASHAHLRSSLPRCFSPPPPLPLPPPSSFPGYGYDAGRLSSLRMSITLTTLASSALRWILLQEGRGGGEDGEEEGEEEGMVIEHATQLLVVLPPLMRTYMNEQEVGCVFGQVLSALTDLSSATSTSNNGDGVDEGSKVEPRVNFIKARRLARRMFFSVIIWLATLCSSTCLISSYSSSSPAAIHNAEAALQRRACAIVESHWIDRLLPFFILHCQVLWWQGCGTSSFTAANDNKINDSVDGSDEASNADAVRGRHATDEEEQNGDWMQVHSSVVEVATSYCADMSHVLKSVRTRLHTHRREEQKQKKLKQQQRRNSMEENRDEEGKCSDWSGAGTGASGAVSSLATSVLAGGPLSSLMFSHSTTRTNATAATTSGRGSGVKTELVSRAFSTTTHDEAAAAAAAAKQGGAGEECHFSLSSTLEHHHQDNGNDNDDIEKKNYKSGDWMKENVNNRESSYPRRLPHAVPLHLHWNTIHRHDLRCIRAVLAALTCMLQRHSPVQRGHHAYQSSGHISSNTATTTITAVTSKDASLRRDNCGEEEEEEMNKDGVDVLGCCYQKLFHYRTLPTTYTLDDIVVREDDRREGPQDDEQQQQHSSLSVSISSTGTDLTSIEDEEEEEQQEGQRHNARNVKNTRGHARINTAAGYGEDIRIHGDDDDVESMPVSYSSVSASSRSST